MQLPDWRIAECIASGEIGLDPFVIDNIQPASIDIRLGDQFRTENGLLFGVRKGLCEALYPNQFLLGHTLEHLSLPAWLAARVEGKSSIGRRGIAIHVTAGFVDPGFEGQLTLELKNMSTTKQFQLWPGMLIAQISFHELSDAARRPYGHPDLGSHYQGQTGPEGAAT